MDAEGAPPPPAGDGLAERLTAAGAPVILPAGLASTWLTLYEAPPPKLTLSTLVRPGKPPIELMCVETGRTDLHTYAPFLKAEFKEGTIYVYCRMPGCVRGGVAFKLVTDGKVGMGNLIKHFMSKACPRAVLTLKDFTSLMGGGAPGEDEPAAALVVAGAKTPRPTPPLPPLLLFDPPNSAACLSTPPPTPAPPHLSVVNGDHHPRRHHLISR